MSLVSSFSFVFLFSLSMCVHTLSFIAFKLGFIF
nr:MAG TPA: hypothetical protein [Caudoviricetes sp.]